MTQAEAAALLEESLEELDELDFSVDELEPSLDVLDEEPFEPLRLSVR